MIKQRNVYTVLRVWYIFSIETKTEEKTQASMVIKVKFPNTVTVMISFV